MFGNLFKRDSGPFRLRIEGHEGAIEVPPKTTLLKAALDQGVPFPHSCRAGGCATCKCRLVEGKVKELTDKSYLLSAEELRDSYILACQSIPRSDVTVAVQLSPEAAEVKFVAGRVAGFRRLTHDILEVTLTLDEPMPYRAGQYADLSVPGRVSAPRSYSFAQPPARGEAARVVFHVRLLPGGELSGWLDAADRTGEEIALEGPYGDFWLRDGAAPLLCVAGGTGMAPLKALLKQAGKDRVRRDVVYLFGARTQRDLYCLDDMSRLAETWPAGFRFIPVLSEEPADSGWSGRRGLVTDHLDDAGLAVADREAYLCGPPPMLDAAIEALRGLGVAERDIHFDKFLDRSDRAS